MIFFYKISSFFLSFLLFSSMPQKPWCDHPSVFKEHCCCYLVTIPYPTLCNPMDCSLSGSSLQEIFQAGILEWLPLHLSRGSSQLMDQTWISCLAIGFFFLFFFFSSTSLLLPTHLPPPSCTHAQSCNPMDCSPPGSSVHGLFQARILEWVAISFSQMDSLLLSHLGSPIQRTLVHNICISMNENCGSGC